MIHFIALVTLNKHRYAYHFSSADKKKIMGKQNELIKDSSSPQIYSLHILKNKKKSFLAIQKMDPYFEDVEEVDTINKFLSLIKCKKSLNDLDVAAYLLKKFKLHPFALQKSLYYIYSDYLVRYKRKLFDAKFLTFDRGPVDKHVYIANKYVHGDLLNNIEFYKKNIHNKKVVDFINKTVKKYGDYYDHLWIANESSDPNKNLTHRKNTPWSITKKNSTSRNSIISDDNIIRYHHNEKFI